MIKFIVPFYNKNTVINANSERLKEDYVSFFTKDNKVIFKYDLDDSILYDSIKIDSKSMTFLVTNENILKSGNIDVGTIKEVDLINHQMKSVKDDKELITIIKGYAGYTLKKKIYYEYAKSNDNKLDLALFRLVNSKANFIHHISLEDIDRVANQLNDMNKSIDVYDKPYRLNAASIMWDSYGLGIENDSLFTKAFFIDKNFAITSVSNYDSIHCNYDDYSFRSDIRYYTGKNSISEDDLSKETLYFLYNFTKIINVDSIKRKITYFYGKSHCVNEIKITDIV